MVMHRNRIGSISLGIALAGFIVVTLQPWLPLDRILVLPRLSLKGLLESFFDAALVGSLADWFAVTALFRHPLGVPLPHTNILAKSKDGIAEGVPRFLAGFLSTTKIASELAKVDFSGKLVEVMKADGAREDVRGFVHAWLPSIFRNIPGTEAVELRGLGGLIRQALTYVGEKIDTAAGTGTLIRWALREGALDNAIEGVSGLLEKAISANMQVLAAAITPVIRQNAGWQGLFVSQATIERLLLGIQNELAAIRMNPGHQLRLWLASTLSSLAGRLDGTAPDPEGERERLHSLVRTILTNESYQSGFVASMESILAQIGSDDSRIEGFILEGYDRAVRSLEQRTSADGEFRLKFNRTVAGFLSTMIERTRLIEGFTAYLSTLLKRTDDREFVARVEAAVWNDLQYIRVNGAVVGGLVGLLLAVTIALS